jgi:hypothetical protein
MRAIFLYGHMLTVAAAYRHLDALLRKHQVDDVALAITTGMNEQAAQALRDGGNQLWFCGPTGYPSIPSVQPSRELLADSWHELTRQVAAAFHDYRGTTQPA